MIYHLRNYSIFKGKYLINKNSNQNLAFKKDCKFIVDEWLQLKHGTVKLINVKENANLVINIIKLYNSLVDINEKIEITGAASYEGKEFGNLARRLDTLFENALKSFGEIEKLLVI